MTAPVCPECGAGPDRAGDCRRGACWTARGRIFVQSRAGADWHRLTAAPVRIGGFLCCNRCDWRAPQQRKRLWLRGRGCPCGSGDGPGFLRRCR